MRRNSTLGILFVLIAAHIALAAYFASVTPFRSPGVILSSRGTAVTDIGAPDERQHVNYIARLAHSSSLPVFDPNDPNLGENYQSHQPPAFYLLATAWATLSNIYLPPAPPATEGKEMTQSDGLKLRALNVVVGAVTVSGVFFLAFWAYRSEAIGLAAAAFAALLPMNAALSGAVSNDPLLICFCTWSLALVARGMSEGWTTRLAVGVGVLTGLAILTKTTGVALLPALLIAVAVRGAQRPTLTQFIAALVPILILVLPWWIRNFTLYGDPLAIGAFNQAFKGSPQASMFIQSFGPLGYWTDWVGAWTMRSFVGVFGYMDIFLTDTGLPAGQGRIYVAAWVLMLVAFVGWILAMKSEAEDLRRVHLVNFVFFLIVLLLFMRFNSQYFQAQARYIFPALGPIAAGIGAGLVTLARGRWALAIALVLLVFGTANGIAIRRLPDEFARRTGTAVSNP
jgi:4-amino-4-deoxy-L-arabinose transferase-like glycosyltransferase